MEPTNNLPTHSVDNFVTSIRNITNRADQAPVSVANPSQDIRFLSSPYNSPPQMMTPRINPADTLRGISQLHSRLDEMLKNSTTKTQFLEHNPNVEVVTVPNSVHQREMTRPGSIQPSYRSEVLEKFSQAPTNVSVFPLSPKLETFAFSGAETPSLPNSAPLYDKHKLEHILANIKSRDGPQHVPSPQLHVDQNPSFQSYPQPPLQSVMSPYARPQEFNNPQMNPYAQAPNVNHGFPAPQGYPQNAPPQYQQHQQYQQPGHFYHSGMTQPNQPQSPYRIQSPQLQYADDSYHQAPQMEQQMRAPYYNEARGHPQLDPRYQQQQQQTPQVYQMPAHVYERGIPEEFGELEADEEEYEEVQQHSRRDVRRYEPQQEVQQGFRSGNKRRLQARYQEEEQREQDGALWGQFQNDDDSLIMKNQPTRQETVRRNNKQNNENQFGQLEDDSYRSIEHHMKQAPKAQSKQKTNKRERSRRRGGRKEQTEQRIIPDDIYTQPVIEQGPIVQGKVEGKVGRPRRNSKKRNPIHKAEEPTQTHTNAVEKVNTVIPPVQSFGTEFGSGGNFSKKSSPEKIARTPKMSESTDFQLKERSPYKNNQVLAELERGLEFSATSEIKKLHQDTLNQFETLSEFVFKGNNAERESPNDSITKAFDQAKCQSPFKLSPQKVQVKETVARKTELVFKNKDSRRRLVR